MARVGGTVEGRTEALRAEKAPTKREGAQVMQSIVVSGCVCVCVDDVYKRCNTYMVMTYEQTCWRALILLVLLHYYYILYL